MGFFDNWFGGKPKKTREDFSQLSQEELDEKADIMREELIENYKLNKINASIEELKGLNGLRNLGNTCYMNSALQCLSNTKELTEFLLSKDWMRQINTVNSIGSRGKLLCAYAELLRSLWNGESGDYAVPRRFKKELGRENGQFSGYDQHDSQEFLSYLMDNLHEDLNIVLKKPYIEIKDFDPNTMDINEYAKECEKNFKMRNNSFMTKLFYGQFQSSISCPDCPHISICFDAFNMISVPLNKLEKFSVYIMTKAGMFKFTKITVYLPADATLGDLRSYIRENKEDINIDKLRFYRFGATTSRSRYRRSEDDFHMRLYEKSERTSHYSDLYNDDDAFPFLVDDQIPEYLTCPVEDSVIVLFRISHNEECQNLTKPLRLARNIAVIKLYMIVFDIAKGSCQDWRNKEFEEFFGTKEEPIAYRKWPFLLQYKGEESALKGIFDNEEREFEDYDMMTIYLREEVLERSENFGRKLSISSRDIRTSSTVDIYSCFSKFTKNETLDEDNTWYCSKCKDHKQASKEMRLSNLPKILIIHLKRFSRSKYSYSKNTSLVDFPLENLDLSNFMIDNTTSPKYNLYGVINHMGGMGGGHYTAYVKTPAHDNLWVEFDDSSVSKVSPKEVISRSAYVLFYRRAEE